MCTQMRSPAQERAQVVNPRVLCYVVARLTGTAGDAVGTVALPFFVLAAGHPATDIGLVLGARTLPYLLLPALGALLALWSRPVTLLGCSLLRAVGQLLTVVSATALGDAFAALLVLQFLVGTAGALSLPASGAVVPLFFAEENIARANAFFSIANTAVVLVGSAAGGLLVGLAGPAGALLLDAGAYLVSAAAFLPVWRVLAGPRDGGRPRPAVRAVLLGLRMLVRTRHLVAMTALMFALNVAVNGPLLVLGPALLAQDPRAGALSWGLVTAAITAGSALGALIGARRGMERSAGSLVVCPLLCTALPAAFGAGLPLAAVLVGAALFGIPMGALGVTLATFIQGTFAVRDVSTVYAFVIWGAAAAAPLGSLLGSGVLQVCTAGAGMALLARAALLIAAGQALVTLSAARPARAARRKR